MSVRSLYSETQHDHQQRPTMIQFKLHIIPFPSSYATLALGAKHVIDD